jgi:Domain of unknown function (DUF305)
MWQLATRRRLGTAIFGACILIAFAMHRLVLAQELHPASRPVAVSGDESPFLKENQVAMAKMMNGMSVEPTGNIDRDFVAMMTPHHRGAIDMAVIELRYGENEQLRRIAQEIIVDQMQEIAAMKLAVNAPVTDSQPAPTQPQPAEAASEHLIAGIPMEMPTCMAK